MRLRVPGHLQVQVVVPTELQPMARMTCRRRSLLIFRHRGPRQRDSTVYDDAYPHRASGLRLLRAH